MTCRAKMVGGKKSRKGKGTRKSKMNKSCKRNVRFYRFIRSNVAPKRLNILRGGSSSVSPATFSNNDIAASPQSYLPYNNFANDPGYSVVSSSNTGPFLTGVSSGGKRSKKSRSAKKYKKRMTRIVGGGDAVTTGISNGLNTAMNGIGIMPVPAINETSGVAGVISGFSNTGSAYNSTNYRSAPLG